MSGRTPVVAVIDSGIDGTMENLGKLVSFSTGFTVNDGFIVEDTRKKIDHEHGTVISLIIRSISSDIELKSVNVLGKKLTTDFRILLYALYYSIEYLNVDIIHMSLSTANPLHYFRLRPIIKQALKKDILIVSALDNNERWCLPAYMKGVIGVKADETFREMDFRYDGRFFIGPGKVHRHGDLGCLDGTERTGTSYAAAYITGYLAKYLFHSGFLKRHEAVDVLKKNLCNNMLLMLHPPVCME